MWEQWYRLRGWSFIQHSWPVRVYPGPTSPHLFPWRAPSAPAINTWARSTPTLTSQTSTLKSMGPDTCPIMKQQKRTKGIKGTLKMAQSAVIFLKEYSSGSAMTFGHLKKMKFNYISNSNMSLACTSPLGSSDEELILTHANQHVSLYWKQYHSLLWWPSGYNTMCNIYPFNKLLFAGFL